MVVHKKQESKIKEEKPVETKAQVKTEPVVVSDVITETTERIEVVKEVPVSQSSVDPLTDFKEKMAKEEKSVLNDEPKKNYMWPILLIFVITILLLAGVFLYKYGINIKDKVNVVTLSPTPVVATPEPTKAVDLTKYEIEIQNGSGVSGEASRQEDNLKEEGFVISSIGNADNSDYTDTIIKAKAEVEKGFLDKLKNVLENTFTVGETEVLPDDSSAPVVVILGTKK